LEVKGGGKNLIAKNQKMGSRCRKEATDLGGDCAPLDKGTGRVRRGERGNKLKAFEAGRGEEKR